ncbi:hypothetical protein H9L39_18473 [Fusarium oxysporum f. sp. albedinis]|nr:hypothetical protein H9L39_18473 [Fusarium oxysporum f. sp. albedinis]
MSVEGAEYRYPQAKCRSARPTVRIALEFACADAPEQAMRGSEGATMVCQCLTSGISLRIRSPGVSIAFEHEEASIVSWVLLPRAMASSSRVWDAGTGTGIWAQTTSLKLRGDKVSTRPGYAREESQTVTSPMVI